MYKQSHLHTLHLFIIHQSSNLSFVASPYIESVDVSPSSSTSSHHHCSWPSLLRGISSWSRTEHASSNRDLLDNPWNYLSNKYSWTKIRFRMKELCHLYFRYFVLSELFPARPTSNVLAINPCRKFQMRLRLIRWKSNLMGLPNIRKYSVFINWSLPETWWLLQVPDLSFGDVDNS